MPGPPVPTGAPVVLGTGKRVIVTLVLTVACDLLFSLVDIVGTLTYPTWNDMESAFGGPGEGLLALGAMTLGFPWIVLQVTLVVLFCLWIRRANRNARALGSRAMEFTPGWCVGWWFVPIAHLFKPYQAVKEVYLASSPDHDATGWRLAAVPPAFGVWWGAWLVSVVAGNISTRMSFSAAAAAQAIGSYFGLASAVAAIVAASLLARIIGDTESRQAAKAVVVGVSPN